MKRLLPFVALLVALLGGFIALVAFLNPERHRQEISDAIFKLVKKPVVLGPLSMTYFPPTLKVMEFGITQAGGVPVVQADVILAPLDLTALLKLRFSPAELQVEHLRLTFQRQADGSWDNTDWLSGFSTASSGHGPVLNQVRWKESEIHWVDKYAAVPQDLVLGAFEGNWDPHAETLNMSGTFSGLSSTANMTLKAKGQFLASPQWSGDVQFTDDGNTFTAHVEDKSGAYDIKANTMKWPIRNAMTFVKFYGRGTVGSADAAVVATLDHWQIHVAGAPSRFSFDQAGEIGGGAVEVKGSIEPRAEGPLLHAEGAVKGVPAEAFWYALGQNIPLSGHVTAVAADIEMILSGRALTTLKGRGYLEINEGRLALSPAIVQRLAKAKTMTYLQRKFPEMATQELPFTRVDAHWESKQGRISTDDGRFVTSNIKGSWVGTFDADREGLDGYLRTQIHETQPALAKLVPPKYRTQPAFGHLQGTWKDWSVRSIRPTKIPFVVQAKLRKSIASR